MATVQAQINALVEELRESENLSPARVEAVEMTLAHLAARGEWPPLPNITMQAVEIDVSMADGDKSAARVAAALRAIHVPVTGRMHKAIAGALVG